MAHQGDYTRDDVEALDPYEIIPHGDRYIVEKLEMSNTVAVDMGDGRMKNIIVPPTAHAVREEAEGYYFARVIAKGNGHRLEADVTVPMPFNPGDVVMVERFSGREIKLGRRVYTIINQVDCLARVPELVEQAQDAAEAELHEQAQEAVSEISAAFIEA